MDNYGSVSLRPAGLTNGWGTGKIALPLRRQQIDKLEFIGFAELTIDN